MIWNDVQSWQVSAFGTDVRNANDQVGRDLALNVEIPGLDVRWSTAAPRHKDYSAIVILSFRREGSERRKYMRHAAIDLDHCAQGFLIEKSQAILVGERPFP